MPDDILDCLVIGGGPAGLAAAIQLARLRRSCLIVDDDAGRSLWSQVTRNHLGFPDGVSASDLRILGLRQAVNHGVELRAGRVVGLRRAGRPGSQRGGTGATEATDPRTGVFIATIEPRGDPETEAEELAEPGAEQNRRRERREGVRLGETVTRRTITIRARTVLIATGVVDEFPAFPDRDLCVGISLFWCIVCDGSEAIGRPVAVVGDDADAIATAFGLLRFTDRVTLITGQRRSSAPAARLRALEQRGVRVERSPVEAYQHTDGQIERLLVTPRSQDCAGEVACAMVFVSSPKRPRVQLARRLGAGVDEAGYLLTDDSGRTSATGVYAAGDVTAGHAHQVTTGAHLGATAATAVNWDLYDDVERGTAESDGTTAG